MPSSSSPSAASPASAGLRTTLGLASVLCLGALASQRGAVDDAPAGLQTLFYDGLDASGRLVGGRTLVPDTPDLDTVAVTPAPVTTLTGLGLARGGGGDNRVDLVFVGDGYTAAEQGDYQNDVNDVVAGLFTSEPLGRYADYFAVHRIDVVSNESGVDNDPVQGIDRDTELDMGYWCNGIERLLCVSVGAAYSYANNAPDVDQVIALANSNKYGGAGYPSSNLATSSGGNGAAIEIVKHELGHSLGKLADEYTYGGPTTWPGGEPSRRNVSIFDAATMANLGTKWADWLGASAGGFDGTIDTYEGANYSVLGIYRPSPNSLMRALNRPFNLVGAQEVIREIYREVRPIDDSSDPAGTYGDTDVLFVAPMAVGGAPLSVQWFQGGAPIPGATQTTLDLATLTLSGCVAEISVTVRDETPWVRDEAFRDAFMTESRTFQINTEWTGFACATTPNSVGSGAVLGAFGSPSVSDRDLSLGVYGGPPLATVLYFYADTLVSQPLGDGILCASSATGASARLALASFDVLGTSALEVDWDSDPVTSGPTALLPGTTWYFQAWYRDAAPGGGATFDFSSAVSVRFCP